MVASLLRRMHWLQTQENGTYSLQSLQLDIVGFLAILGEGSVLANAQVSTLSRWIFLPRLIPAPQALMRPTRPLDLEPAKGDVSGVLSGNDRDHINYIGNIICDGNNLPKHSVRIVNIERINDKPIKSKPFGPLTYVAWLGFILSAMLLGISIYLRDGMSIIATVLLSLLSSLIGLGNYWTLELPKRKIQEHRRNKNDTIHEKSQPSQIAREENNSTQLNDLARERICETGGAKVTAPEAGDHVPDGDVVIRYPKGNFLVVRCHENVARELYFAPEEIEYMVQDAWIYRLLSLVGTMMLMGGVICLANARIESQIAWAGSYMLLGAAYWIVAALPAKVHWDTSCYEVRSEALTGCETHTKRNFFASSKKGYPFSSSESFTDALWKAIVASKETHWVRRNNHCPNTKVWDEWLSEAKARSRDPAPVEIEKDSMTIWVPNWNAQESLQKLFKEQKSKKEGV